MSDDAESTTGSEEEEEEEKTFQCTKCGNGKLFSAADRDAHRLWHRAEAEKKAGKRKTRGRESQDRSILFEEVSSPPAKKSRGQPAKKRRSRKTYDTNVKPKKHKGA